MLHCYVSLGQSGDEAPRSKESQLTRIYAARWVLPIVATPIESGGVAVEGNCIAAVGPVAELQSQFPDARLDHLGEAAILPGLINSHSHLELTAMRGFLEHEESDFFAWLRKLTIARMQRMTEDDLRVSVLWGACEAVRAGVTAVGDASDSALISMQALQEIGLRGIVFQESFGPDHRLVDENFGKLKDKIAVLRDRQSELVIGGVSPHAPYTVCTRQLELISEFAITEKLPLMMHAAESAAEDHLLREGTGLFADGLARRAIEWTTPGVSTIQYLKQTGILATEPLLAHCIRVDDADIDTLKEFGAKVAHCPKSNAKLGHGRAPLVQLLDRGVIVGLGSDSVASNNTCDLLEEARFATLFARSANETLLTGEAALQMATTGGAACLGQPGRIGELTEGAMADLTVVSIGAVHQTPVFDPVAALVFASSGKDVVLTVVDGKEVYRNGRVTNVDEARLRARIEEIRIKLSAP
jgi:cytosine/adenosine deaminase-related metal-dependent hydrolase